MQTIGGGDMKQSIEQPNEDVIKAQRIAIDNRLIKIMFHQHCHGHGGAATT